MKAKTITLCLVMLIALVAMGAAVATAANQEETAAPVVNVRLPANQSIEVDCLGDELIIVTSGDSEATLTCRVWFEGEER